MCVCIKRYWLCMIKGELTGERGGSLSKKV